MAVWHAKTYGGYDRTSQEAIDNATLLADAMYNQGWTKKAICAMLGNGAGESGLNPWRWESDIVPTVSQFNNWTSAELQYHGYGIWQFTAPTKYINSTNAATYAADGYSPNFADRPGTAQDGNAQTVYFCDTVGNDFLYQLYSYYYDNFMAIGVDITPWYYTYYSNFILGKDNNGNDLSLNALVGVFELCWERPRDTDAAATYWNRCNNASYWFNILPDGPGPDPPDPPEPPEPGYIPYWLMFKFKDWRKW